MGYEPIAVRLARYNSTAGNATGSSSAQSSTTVVNTFQPFAQCRNSAQPLEAVIPYPILDFNSQRIYAAFINNSPSDITLVLGNILVARIGAGIILKAYGGSYEITQINLYLGAVSAIAPDVAYLSYVECIKE
jgi:hypothetical protein